jgi:hypothetical protein
MAAGAGRVDAVLFSMPAVACSLLEPQEDNNEIMPEIVMRYRVFIF